MEADIIKPSVRNTENGKSESPNLQHVCQKSTLETNLEVHVHIDCCSYTMDQLKEATNDGTARAEPMEIISNYHRAIEIHIHHSEVSPS